MVSLRRPGGRHAGILQHAAQRAVWHHQLHCQGHRQQPTGRTPHAVILQQNHLSSELMARVLGHITWLLYQG